MNSTTHVDIDERTRRRIEELSAEYGIPARQTVARLVAGDLTAAARAATMYDAVLGEVQRSASPVGAARLAQRLSTPVPVIQRLLALASSRGEVVRLTRGLYSSKGASGVVADPVPERTFPNLSSYGRQGARRRYRPREVLVASGRTVVVGPEAIAARLARKAGGGRRA